MMMMMFQAYSMILLLIGILDSTIYANTIVFPSSKRAAETHHLHCQNGNVFGVVMCYRGGATTDVEVDSKIPLKGKDFDEDNDEENDDGSVSSEEDANLLDDDHDPVLENGSDDKYSLNENPELDYSSSSSTLIDEEEIPMDEDNQNDSIIDSMVEEEDSKEQTEDEEEQEIIDDLEEIIPSTDTTTIINDMEEDVSMENEEENGMVNSNDTDFEEDTTATTTTTTILATTPSYTDTDESSTAFVDRMELADAYDDDQLVGDDDDIEQDEVAIVEELPETNDNEYYLQTKTAPNTMSDEEESISMIYTLKEAEDADIQEQVVEAKETTYDHDKNNNEDVTINESLEKIDNESNTKNDQSIYDTKAMDGDIDDDDDDKSDIPDDEEEEEDSQKLVEGNKVIDDNVTEKEDVIKEHDTIKVENNKITSVQNLQQQQQQQQEVILEKQLKYTREEIQAMKPNVAAVVVANKIKCPKNGMPLHFYKDGYSPKEKSTILKKNHIRRWISSILLTSITLFFVNHTNSHKNGKISENATTILNTLPETSAPSINYEDPLESVPTTNIPRPSSPLTKSIPPRIIDPNQKKRDKYRSDLDATWLDRGITKTLRFFDKIFTK